MKIYTKEVFNKFGKKLGISEIACFEENGKYYLRFSILNGLYYYGGEKRSCFTKEFATKESANNYFKKVSEGFKRIK